MGQVCVSVCMALRVSAVSVSRRLERRGAIVDGSLFLLSRGYRDNLIVPS